MSLSVHLTRFVPVANGIDMNKHKTGRKVMLKMLGKEVHWKESTVA